MSESSQPSPPPSSPDRHFPEAGRASRFDEAPEREPSEFITSTGKGGPRLGVLTVVLIAICVGVALYTSIGDSVDRLLPLFISQSPASDPAGPLAEVRAGEVWRLFTPMFIHFGLLHLIFNMIWLKDIGFAIEHRNGSLYLLAMVLVLALCSDLGQYFVNGPYFGGMSGVVYGLFGYVWLRSVFDPASGYRIPGRTVVVMLVWFVFCLTGILNVANTAHGVGLAVGAAWGFLAAKLAAARRGNDPVVVPF